MGRPSDDDRYRGMLHRRAPDLSAQVRYVSIANEADECFSAHPNELPAFRRFAPLAGRPGPGERQALRSWRASA